MNAAATVVGAVAGAAAGLGMGWIDVLLERVEELEEEEAEERREYEQENRQLAAVARGNSAPVPATEPWHAESYGWTWQKRLLSPLLGAIGFATFVAHEDWGAGLLVHLLWVTVFVQIVIFDLEHRLILNRVTYPAILAAIALAPLSPGLSVVHAVVGAAVVFVFFYVQSFLFGGGALGQGDAKLGALVGAVAGLGLDHDHFGAIYAVIAAVLLGGVISIILLATRVRGLRDPIPYGPFLCAGAALILFVGPAAS